MNKVTTSNESIHGCWFGYIVVVSEKVSFSFSSVWSERKKNAQLLFVVWVFFSGWTSGVRQQNEMEHETICREPKKFLYIIKFENLNVLTHIWREKKEYLCYANACLTVEWLRIKLFIRQFDIFLYVRRCGTIRAKKVQHRNCDKCFRAKPKKN